MPRIAVNRGFTLIELMVVIAIAAILVRVAVPGMQSMMEGSAVNKHVTTFMSDLRYARSEAIKAGAPVVMCRSASSEAATPTCTTAGSSDWQTGWIIFVNRADSGAANSYLATDGDTLLRVQGPFTDSGGMPVQGGSAVDKFVFRATGMMSAGAATLVFNTASLNAARQKAVCISLQGRARLLPDSTTACNS